MQERSPRRLDGAGFVIAAGLLALAAVIAWDAMRMAAAPAYARIGPTGAPYVIACGLTLLAVATALGGWRGALPDREPADWHPVVLILAGLALLILVIGFGGGFVIATALLFAATSRAFGHRGLVTDLAAGFVLALVIYLVFDKLLRLTLPTGPLERLL